MSELYVSLLPFILGSALLPIQIIIVILILNSPHQGVLKASAYVGGMTLMRLLQGLVFGLILSCSELADDEQGKSLVALTLITVLGILLLVTAYRQWRTEDDPDAPPPKWMAMIDGLTPLKALGFGFGLLLICGKCWVFILGAIGEIAEAERAVRGHAAGEPALVRGRVDDVHPHARQDLRGIGRIVQAHPVPAGVLGAVEREVGGRIRSGG